MCSKCYILQVPVSCTNGKTCTVPRLPDPEQSLMEEIGAALVGHGVKGRGCKRVVRNVMGHQRVYGDAQAQDFAAAQFCWCKF